jgi:hypothetical protein
MSIVKDLVEGVGGAIGTALNAVVGVVSGVGNAIAGQVNGLARTLTGIMEDPLPTLLQVGGSLVGIPPYVTAAVITAARGGNLEDVAKSAAISYGAAQIMGNTNIGKEIGKVTQTAGQDFTDSMVKNFNLPVDTAVAVSKAATASLNSSIIGGVNAAISGKNVMDGITSGFTSGLIYSSTSSYFDELNKDPNWGLSPKTLDLMKGAGSSALNSIVSGKDPSQAVGNYIASAFISMGETTLKKAATDAFTELTTDTNAAKAAQDKYITAKAELDDKARRGEALRKEINDESAAYQKTITEKYNPLKAEYDKLAIDSAAAVNTYTEHKKIYEDNIGSYNNYQNIIGQYGGHYESRSAGDADYEAFISHAPSRQSFLDAANAAAATANAAGKTAENASIAAQKLMSDNQSMIDSLTSGKALIDKKVADFQAIKKDIEDPSVAGSTAATLKAASDAYQTKYDAWSKTKSAADRSAENYTKALAEVATRDATIDALNTGAIKVTSKDADNNWVLDNGMTLTAQGKFVQNGQQVFAGAVGVPQKVMDFKANDGSNVDFNSEAGRVLSETDVVNICKRDYGFEPTTDEIDRLAGATYTGTGNQDITALADQKATAAYRSVTGTDPTADELAAIKRTNNVVGSAISLAKTGDADPWGNLEGAMLKGASGQDVKLTDAQLTEMVRKGLVFEGGDFNTKQDAANAARLAGYTQFEYDNSVYTMQPGGPTEKDVFKAAIDMQPTRGEAFNTARSLLGADKTFDYKGAAYTTETREERNARQYNSDAAIQARVDLIPAVGGSINTRTGTPANVSNTFIDQKTNQVVEDTRVWDVFGNVVSGSLSVADQPRALQVAGSLVLDAGTQMIDAFTGAGKFLGAVDKNGEFAKNVNQLVNFNKAQTPPEVSAESAIFWSNVKNAQGIADTAKVVLSSVVDQPLMTGFNIASEIIQTMGTLGAGAGVKYASTLLKAAPTLAAKLGIGVDVVLNIGESAGAAYNESYKKALNSVGAQVRDGSMTTADAEAYAEDTAGKTFLAAAGVTGAVMLLPGGNALAKQVLGSGAETAAMKTAFKEAIKTDAAKVGYKLAAGTSVKETIAEGGEAGLIEAVSQKILNPDADYNWKDITVTTMLDSIYGGGHSAVIAAADVAVSNFKDRLISSGVDQTEVENLTNKVTDLVKSGNVSDASIAALKTETANLFQSVGLRIDPTLDLMNDQFLAGVVSQEVAGELSLSGLSPEQIAKNLSGAVAHVESGQKIDPTYVDPFLTDEAEARQIAQSLGYTNPSPEVLKSLTGPISEADAQIKLDKFLGGMNAFESGKPIDAAAAQGMVKDLGLTNLSDAEAISLATKIVQSVPADKLSEPKMTPEQVRTIIDEFIVANPTLTEVQVGRIVNDAIAKIPAGTSAADISSLVTTAISNIPSGLSIDDVSRVVTDATKNLTTKLDTEKAISDAIGKINFPAGITTADVTSAIKTYMTENPGLSLSDVAGKITESTKGLATDTSVQNAISTALKDVATTADVNKAISNIKFPAGITAADVAAQVKAELIANPGLTAEDVAGSISAYMTANPGLSAADVKAVIDDSTKNFATKKNIEDAIAEIKFPAGITSADVSLAITNYMKENPGLTLQQVSDAITTGTSGLATDAGVKTSISDALKGVATKTDVADAIKGIVFPAGISKDDVTNSIAAYMKENPGLSIPDVTAAITTYMTANPALTATDVTSIVSNATKDLVTNTALNTALAGVTTDVKTKFDALTQAQKDAVADQLQQGKDLTKAITDTASGLQANIDALSGTVKTQYDSLTQAQKDAVADQVQQGKDLTKAITDSASGLQTQITGLTTDVKTKYDALTQAQKDAVASQVQQGKDLTTVINNTASGLQTQITGLSVDSQTKYDALTQGQKDIVANQAKQGVDLTTAINDASKLATQQVADVKKDVGALTTDVQAKYDLLNQGQKDIVATQVKLGVDVNKAIEDAAKTTSGEIAAVKTELKKDIGEGQTQFNTRVDDLVKQGLTFQTATQKALDEIKATQTAEAAKAETLAKSGRAATAQAGIAQNLQNAVQRITPSPGLVDTSTPGFANIGLKTTGEAKFEGPLEQYMKMLTGNSYAAKPQETQQTQQVAPVQDELSAQQQPGSDYFAYGQQTDIDLAQGPGTDMLYSKAGGLATPLFAGGGTTRHGRFAGGGLNVVEHSGKARIDFRSGNAVTGPGDGQSDDIPAMLADGEFVFPADVVAALGNGSTKAGSDKLYDMMHSIRAYHRSAKPRDLPPPAKKSPLDYLKKRKVRR